MYAVSFTDVPCPQRKRYGEDSTSSASGVMASPEAHVDLEADPRGRDLRGERDSNAPIPLVIADRADNERREVEDDAVVAQLASEHLFEDRPNARLRRLAKPRRSMSLVAR